jgi:hypothetical protein
MRVSIIFSQGLRIDPRFLILEGMTAEKFFVVFVCPL